MNKLTEHFKVNFTVTLREAEVQWLNFCNLATVSASKKRSNIKALNAASTRNSINGNKLSASASVFEISELS